jgi:hypothetical protein
MSTRRVPASLNSLLAADFTSINRGANTQQSAHVRSINTAHTMNAMKGFFSAPQMDDPSGMYMMDMDMDHDDAVAIMAAMQESEGPQVKMVDLDFFNGTCCRLCPVHHLVISLSYHLQYPCKLADFGDDFDDDDLN